MEVVFDGRVIQDRFPGIGRYAFRLLEAMLSLEPELQLRLLYVPRAPNQRWDLRALDRFPAVQRIPVSIPPFAPAEHLAIPWLLQRWPKALVHVPYYAVPLGLLRRSAPLGVTLHDFAPLRLPAAWSPLQRWLYRIWHRCVLARADAVFVISRATQEDLFRLFGAPRGRVAVTPEAVDPHFFPRPPRDVAGTLSRYGLQHPYAFWVGVNKPSKNIDRFLKAWARVRERLLEPSATLVLAGLRDPRYPLRLRPSVRDLGMVPEEDLPALYTGARLFIFPSLWEGFGLPMLEAMACGVPVACSDIPALREVAGEAAMFFDPRDVEGMARVLEVAWRRAEDPAWRAAAQARAAQFSWQETAQRTLELYRGLV
ncbi:MAG: glycosyltransferase family 4 protein [Thermoflexus sp.]|jgi:glycosyltransferase involved in cell wall biosynthesis|nr:glycosyltransferase family 4 protein [Thermoflexus sp.]